MTLRPLKPITKPGEGKGSNKQRYLTRERFLEERYKISTALKGSKRLDDESYEDYKLRLKAENSLLKEYLRGVWLK